MKTYTVNLEEGLPFVAEAMQHIDNSLARAKRNGDKVIKFIHGYGSSGKGGKIKTAARKKLLQLQAEGQVWLVIKGENFNIFDSDTQKAMSKYFFISKDSDMGRANLGITMCILK